MEDYTFENVRHALCWATENLRNRTFPKVSNIYKSEVLSDADVKKWSMWRENLPKDKDESFLLSMKVYKFVYNLNEYDKGLILMRYLGDYHTKDYLKSALNIKEAMRLRGQHVRLNYRFSVRQVAACVNEHYSKIHRALGRIEGELETKMRANGLIGGEPMRDVQQNKPLEKQGKHWGLEDFRNS